MSDNGMGYVSLEGLIDPELELEAQAWDGQSAGMIDPGEYVFEVVEAKMGQSKGTPPKPQLEVQVEIVEGESAGRRTRNWYYLTPKAVKRLNALLVATGVPLDDRLGFSLHALTGARFMATIIHETRPAFPDPARPGQLLGGQPRSKIIGERAIPQAPKMGTKVGAKSAPAVNARR